MIRRLALTLLAVTAVAGSPIAASLAHADEQGRGGGRGQSHGRDRGGSDRGGWRGERGGGERWERRGPPDRGPERRYEDRRGDARRGDDRRDYPDERRRAAPRPGGYLPPSYQGRIIEDPGRYRLRPPPRGYAWVRMRDGYGLVSLGDGRVYDIVPD